MQVEHFQPESKSIFKLNGSMIGTKLFFLHLRTSFISTTKTTKFQVVYLYSISKPMTWKTKLSVIYLLLVVVTAAAVVVVILIILLTVD